MGHQMNTHDLSSSMLVQRLNINEKNNLVAYSLDNLFIDDSKQFEFSHL